MFQGTNPETTGGKHVRPKISRRLDDCIAGKKRKLTLLHQTPKLTYNLLNTVKKVGVHIRF